MVVDRETVLGSLRATGSWDPDVLQDLRARLVSPARGAKRLGLVLVAIGTGGVLSLTLVPVAILLVVAGWWLRRRGQRSEAMVEQVFREFVRGTGQPAGSGAAIPHQGRPTMHKTPLGVMLAAALFGLGPVAAAQGGGCAGQPGCAETREFTATVTNFRPSTIDARTRAIAITLKFQNRSTRPLILAYVAESGVITDDEGNRYQVAPNSVRGIGVVNQRDFDPKFVLQPGEASDARLEFLMQVTGPNQIRGTRYEMDLAVREVEAAPANQFRLGREHALHYSGLGPTAMADGAADAGAAPAAPAPAPTPAPEPERDPCAGKPRCYAAGPFLAEVTRLTPSSGGRHHILELVIRFRNLTAEPLILGYAASTSGAVDNLGNRYYWGRAGTYDGSVKGMGMVTARSADPQFVLGPGQSRTATFTLVRYEARPPFGTAFNYNVTIKQLEIVSGQAVRTLRDFTVDFPDLSTTVAANAAAAGARKLLDAVRKP